MRPPQNQQLAQGPQIAGHPSSQAAASTDETRSIDMAEMELSCIELICQLESLLATARESERSEQVANASKTASQMLVKLLEFAERYFSPEQAEETVREIVKASNASEVHQEILKRRPWHTAIASRFRGNGVDENALASHAQLGKSLARACAMAFYHTAAIVGTQSSVGLKIVQSNLVFINELEKTW